MHSSVDERMNILAIVNNAEMKMRVSIPLRDPNFVSFGYMGLLDCRVILNKLSLQLKISENQSPGSDGFTSELYLTLKKKVNSNFNEIK